MTTVRALLVFSVQLLVLAHAMRPESPKALSLAAAKPKEEDAKPKEKEKAKDEKAAAAKAEAPEKATTRSAISTAKLPSKCECEFQDYCTCDGVLKYLDCISKKCASNDCDCHHDQFEASCANLGTMCGDQLDFTCATAQATCQGKFHQLSDGIMGITVETESLNKKSYCGPFGKCQGTVEAKVKVSHAPEEGALVQCEMQRYEGAKEIDGKGWEKCQAKVDQYGDAVCSLQMPGSLKAGGKLEGKCVAAALGKKRLKQHRYVKQTKDAWWQVSNKYEGSGSEKSEKKESDKDVEAESGARHQAATGLGLLGLLVAVSRSL